MQTSIFRDDSSLEDKRDAAVDRLMAMCPQALRIPLRAVVVQAIENCDERTLDSLLVDVGNVTRYAESGNLPAIVEIAKRYGATDEQVTQFLPMFAK